MSTVQSLYNTPRYNTGLHIIVILLSCGSQFFLQWDFTKELKENDHKWLFSYNSFVKLSLYHMIHL